MTAHRMPDAMRAEIVPLIAQRNMLNVAIMATVRGFLMARGAYLDPAWSLSDDGESIVVGEVPAPAPESGT